MFAENWPKGFLAISWPDSRVESAALPASFFLMRFCEVSRPISVWLAIGRNLDG